MKADNTTWIYAFLLISLGLMVQFAGFVNLDNAWLLHVAGRVIDGEKLGHQVVESNPPLIVYIMEIPTYLAKIFDLKTPYVFTAFIGVISVISLCLTFSQVSGRVLKLLIVFGMFLLPSWAFGEREHIFIILTMPYFVSLWRNDRPGWIFVIISGLLAGIGFCLKPFFLATWAVMVITKMALDRRFWSFFNLQNIIIGLTITAYIAYLVLVEKTYVGDIFPLLVKYYASFNSDSGQVYKQSLGLIFLCQISFWILFFKEKKLITRAIYFCSFANLVSAILVIIQGRIWMNYFYPPNFFGLLSNALIALAVLGNLKPLWNKVVIMLAGLVVAVFLIFAITSEIKLAARIGQEKTGQLIELMNKYASRKRIYALTFNLETIFPALLYSQAQYKGHYGHFWMLPGMYQGQNKDGDAIIFRKPGERIDDETKLIATVMSDFAHNPPELVFVEDLKYYSPNIGNYSFDFVGYFMQEPEFADMWGYYRKIDRIGDTDIYQYQH